MGIEMNKPFWLVWNPEGKYSPQHRHESESAATAEAERLARANQGRQFIVLQTVCSIMVADVVTIDLRPDGPF